MRRLLGLLAIVAVMLLSLAGYRANEVFPDATGTLSFGFLLLAAYICGDALSRFGLPRITGYILAGIAFGPHVLDFVSKSTVAELKLIDDLALTFIAFAAGGELRLQELRARGRSILWTVAFQSILVFGGVAGLVAVAVGLVPFLAGQPTTHVVAVAAILGTFAIARSPSSVIAIISERKARGPFTETVLGVTVVIDVLIIMLFAMVVSVAQVLVEPGTRFDVGLVFAVLAELGGAIAAGVVLGFLIVLYVQRVRAELVIFILGVAFLVTFSSRQFATLLLQLYGLHVELEPMLVCLAAGFVVQNFSKAGAIFMAQIDRSALPIYVVFFALTGAALNVMALRHTWLLALIVVVVRAALLWVGGYVGGRVAQDEHRHATMSGWSYLTQAGVSLGLAGIVMKRFADWGPQLGTLIVAIIAVNQIVGPAGFKYALDKVGEARVGAPSAR